MNVNRYAYFSSSSSSFFYKIYKRSLFIFVKFGTFQIIIRNTWNTDGKFNLTKSKDL